MKISKEMFVRYLINMKVLSGNESDQSIKKCVCNDIKCTGWTIEEYHFEDISKKIKTKHLIVDTFTQTIEEHEYEVNAKLCEDKLKEYAVSELGGHVARGVKDGYDMKSAIFDQILELICKNITDFWVS